jgi:hypothetical protein
VRPGAGGAVTTEPLPPAVTAAPLIGVIGRMYDRVLALLPHSRRHASISRRRRRRRLAARCARGNPPGQRTDSHEMPTPISAACRTAACW